MPKVSVIIPTYNNAKYLSEAIDSILNQSYRDFEIIIVDDGSKDNTKGIAKNYVTEYRNKVKYFYQKNRGVSAARNKGIEESKGEYIALLDSDNIADSHWLENLLKGFLNNEILACTGRNVSQKAKTLIQSVFDLKNKSKKNVTHNFYTTWIDTTNSLIKKSLFTTVGKFDEKFINCEDFEFNQRVNALSVKIYFTHNAVVFFRAREKFSSLLLQWFRYGYYKILLYKKFDSYKKDVFKETRESLFTALYLSGKSFVILFKFIVSRKNRNIIYLLEYPVQLCCSLSNDLGKLMGRLRYNTWL